MIINRPAVDWLTLTTYSPQSSRRMTDLIKSHTDFQNVREQAEGRYAGTGGDGFFTGSAIQNGKDHFLFRLSRDESDKVMFDPLKPPMDCTRIDIQLTLPLPAKKIHLHRLFAMAERRVNEHEATKGQRGRQITLISKENGECTLYIGSMKSKRQCYIYIKDDDEHYRFEVRFKGKNEFAGKVYERINKNPESIVSILRAELDTLPDNTLITPFKLALVGVDGEIIKNGRERSDPNKTYAWIVKMVQPAIKKLLKYHDTRDRMMMFLMEMLDFGKELYSSEELNYE